MIMDDGSTDNSFESVKELFPDVNIQRFEKQRGYIYCRNLMLNTTKTPYAISLDDDAEIMTADACERITKHFENNPECGAIAFRIFWGAELPVNTQEADTNIKQVKSFIGCGHAWNMKAWKDIPQYPEWFEFYGEENYASVELFKKGWQVQYNPAILMHHRVDMQKRKAAELESIRYKNHLRAGLFIIALFHPAGKLLRTFLSSLWQQFKSRLIKEKKLFLTLVIFEVLLSVIRHLNYIIKYRNPYSPSEWEKWKAIAEPVTYWNASK